MDENQFSDKLEFNDKDLVNVDIRDDGIDKKTRSDP